MPDVPFRDIAVFCAAFTRDSRAPVTYLSWLCHLSVSVEDTLWGQPLAASSAADRVEHLRVNQAVGRQDTSFAGTVGAA